MYVHGVVPQYPPYSLVGSWLTTHEFLADLVAHGHQVTVTAYSAGGARPTVIDGVRVQPTFRDIGRPDVVVGHLGDDGSARAVADRTGAPLVVMAHGGSLEGASQRLQGAALAVFNSKALRDAVRWPGRSIVALPPVDPARYAAAPGDRVTLINLSEGKGARLFWALARDMPHVKFLGVRGNYGAQIVLRGPANVTVQRPTPNMATDVYARTRLLLIPSVETFGRVGVEAACSGIPAIAHPCPGTREALGATAVYVDRADTDGWRKAIERFADATVWRRASAKVTDRMRSWNPGAQLDAFRVAVEEVSACVSSP